MLVIGLKVGKFSEETWLKIWKGEKKNLKTSFLLENIYPIFERKIHLLRVLIFEKYC